MAAHTHRTPQNPNERAYGVRACAAVGQQKHADCSGDWVELLGVRSAIGAPHIAICTHHGAQLFKTPKVREVRPKRVARVEEELIL